MSSDYFDSSLYHVTAGTRVRASDVNTALDALDTGLIKLPTEAHIKRGTINYVVDSGAADAYVVTLSYAPVAYTDGMQVVFKALAANTGASTLNVNALGAKVIKRQDGAALVAGDIAADKIVEVRFNTTSDQFEIQGSTAVGTGTMAAQNSNAVSITGGTIADVAITGGTVAGAAITGGTITGVTFNPDSVDDNSANAAAMQATADPYPAGVASLATSLTGEIQRLRYLIKQITGKTYWYVDPDTDIATIKVNLYAPSGTDIIGFCQSAAPTLWTRKTDRQDNAMICLAASGNPGSGGSVTPQAWTTGAQVLQSSGSVGSRAVAYHVTEAAGVIYSLQAGAETKGILTTTVNTTSFAPYYQEVIECTKDA
uniref:Tail protein n=1 Tax=viral metagenome TaxID=1070528 RepID=A0A6H1ZY68_9ZZZZ